MLKPEEMTAARIFDYQMRMEPWDEDAIFPCGDLLGTSVYNKHSEHHGVDEFFSIYNRSEVVAVEIIERMISGR